MKEATPLKTHAHSTFNVLLSLPLLLSCGDATSSASSAPDVIFITIDTLRADHLGTYGYEQDTSPHLDAFASQASVFEVALAQAPNTIPSILQIMTSRYGLPSAIYQNQTTLAGLLHDRGYATAAVVDNPLFEFDPDAHGLTKGFDIFLRNTLLDRENLERQHYKSNTPADVITAQASRVLDSRARETPLFLWLHYFDPHDPYAAPFVDALTVDSSRSGKSTFTGDVRSANFTRGGSPKPSEQDINHIVALYDDEIRYVDESLGDLFAKLENEDMFDESLIIVSSDHGESLGEHGVWMHGRSLYESEIRIPLIVKLPHQRIGKRIARPVQAIDIVPSVVDALSIETTSHFDGKSVFSESNEPALILWLKEKVVRTQEWKLYENRGRVNLYRIDEDPGELRDVAAQHPAVVDELRAMREARLEHVKQSAAELRRLSTEAAEQMRSLGYIK